MAPIALVQASKECPRPSRGVRTETTLGADLLGRHIGCCLCRGRLLTVWSPWVVVGGTAAQVRRSKVRVAPMVGGNSVLLTRFLIVHLEINLEINLEVIVIIVIVFIVFLVVVNVIVHVSVIVFGRHCLPSTFHLVFLIGPSPRNRVAGTSHLQFDHSIIFSRLFHSAVRRSKIQRWLLRPIAANGSQSATCLPLIALTLRLIHVSIHTPISVLTLALIFAFMFAFIFVVATDLPVPPLPLLCVLEKQTVRLPPRSKPRCTPPCPLSYLPSPSIEAARGWHETWAQTET